MGEGVADGKADQTPGLKVYEMKSLLNSQIEISAQVWVCDSCGVTDHKSCSCRATAHSEELKKKKEQDRQRAKAYRDRAASRDADIGNTRESGALKREDSEAERTAFVLRASTAAKMAVYNGRATRAVFDEARYTADVWTKLANELEQRTSNTRESGNGSMIPVLAPIPSRFERKDTAKFTRLLDGLISAGLGRDLCDELKAHGATRLMEALEHRLSPGRNEEDESSTATR